MKFNRLIREKSPYLRQHAHNPVNWWPWCEEAFQKAREEDKPVFLSIGYASCHWCHVMERESFEDPEVARLLNETFICVKVDREERPDIDAVYMAACQMMTGQGGWPLTLLLAPDKRPFFTATYLPKESRFGRLGLKELTERVRDLWKDHREELLRSAEKTVQILRRLADPAVPTGSPPEEALLRRAYEQLRAQFDEQHGGFGSAPKFPLPSHLLLLLRYADRFGNAEALAMVEKTLRAMRAGGVFDQLGYGFHRYSTDTEWRLPHFEKMLYDQALLALAYLEAYQATGRKEYAQTAREIFEYALRELTSPEGGFYGSEDADSEGQEGRYYTWTRAEVREALPPDDAELAVALFGIEPEGNFAEEATGRRTGANVLYLARPPSELARERGLPESRLRLGARIERIREALLRARERRVRPAKDDQILTDWNGLMIAALARGAWVLGERFYAEAAERAASFLFANVRDPRGGLLHRYRDGEAAVPGFLDDYAFLGWGLLELYQATFREEHLRGALTLTEGMLERFWDEGGAGFYFTAEGAETPLLRRKEVYDGATPSGNSVALHNLLRLGHLVGRADFLGKADRLLRALAPLAEASPAAHTHFLLGVDLALGPTAEVVIVGERDRRETQALLHEIRKRFLPHCVVLLRSPEGRLTEIAPFAESLRAVGGKATAYLCRGQSCSRPVTSVAELGRMLDELTPSL